MKRFLLLVVLLGILVYAGDFLSFQLPIPSGRPQFGSVEVHRYYAVPYKNKTTGFMFDQPATETCVHSLFPHFGNPPCWYLSRHKQQEIKTSALSPGGYARFPEGYARCPEGDSPISNAARSHPPRRAPAS